jgi:hypothetical protein
MATHLQSCLVRAILATGRWDSLISAFQRETYQSLLVVHYLWFNHTTAQKSTRPTL